MIGHTRGSGWGQNEPREARGRAVRDSPFSDNTVSLQNVSKLILSHFPLALSIFPSFNPPHFSSLSHSYRPISLILPLYPSSPRLCCSILPTFTAQALNRSPLQLHFSYPTFSLSHLADLKSFPFLSYPPTNAVR